MSLKRRKSSAVGTLSVPNMLSHHTSPSSFKDMPALPPPLPVHDQLKNISQLEHSRRRSVANFLVNLVAGLIAYTYQPNKPSLHTRMPHNDSLSVVTL